MNAWLTRITLDLRSTAVRSDLADVQRMHQRTMTLFPDGLGPQPRRTAGLLYRCEDDNRGRYLLVQSLQRPDPGCLPDGYGIAAVRDLAPMFAALRPGRLVRYRLVGNTTKRAWKDGEHARAGHVVRLVGDAAQDWWQRHAEQAGLDLLNVEMHVLDSIRRPEGAQSRMRHCATRFDGTAVIRDADAVAEAVTSGIGRAKSYGCGLLSLAPAA